MKTLKLNAGKVGNLTVKDLLAFAEAQACELSIQFHKKPDPRVEKTAKTIGQALELHR